MIITEAGIWCLGAFAVVATILGILFKTTSAIYTTYCPSCKRKYWHSKARQGLHCKKCGNVFLSRHVDED